MPLSAFPELMGKPVGTDVTELLGVTYADAEDNIRKANPNPNAKYGAMGARHPKLFQTKLVKRMMRTNLGRKFLFFLFGRKKDSVKGFPNQFPFVHKTDEDRCENLPNVLGYPRPLVVTEKLDGTSSTYILERNRKKKFEFYVCSRNVRQKDENQKCYHDTNIYWDMAFKYEIRSHLESYLLANPSLSYVCIQGESVGSVQCNHLNLPENDLYVFNFIRSDVGRVPSVVGREIVEQWGMKWVPILNLAYFVPNSMEEFKEYADGKSVVNPNVMREGVVLRDPTNDFSFKNVSRKYLLKHNG